MITDAESLTSDAALDADRDSITGERGLDVDIEQLCHPNSYFSDTLGFRVTLCR